MKQGAECGVSRAKDRRGEQPRPRDKGFTLLEVMVAVSIMTMVLVSLLSLKNSSMEDVIRAEHITTATMLAERLMVEATLVKPRTPAINEGPFTDEEFQDYSWSISIIPVPIYAKIMEVHVAVSWMEGTRKESVELVSYE